MYEQHFHYLESMPEIVAEWGGQKEQCPTTGNIHVQGYFRTKRQCRFSQVQKVFPGVHIEVARDWNKAKNYCKKSETAIEGSQFHKQSEGQGMSMAQAMHRLAARGPLPEAPPPDERSVKEREAWRTKQLTEDFWERVNKLLEEDENLIGVYTQPQYLRAWLATGSYWIDRQTDRQEEEE